MLHLAFQTSVALSSTLTQPVLVKTSVTSPVRPRHARRRAHVRRTIRSKVSTPNTDTSIPYTLPQPNPYPAPADQAGVYAQRIPQLQTIPQLFQQQAKDPNLANRLALTDPHHAPTAKLTYGDLQHQIDLFSAGLSRLGLAEHSVVSLFSENSHRWFITDQAIMTCGAAAAVRGVMAPLSELLYIYSHSHSRYLFVETAAVLTRLLDGGLDTTNVDFAVVLFGDAPSDCGLKVHTFEKIIATGASPTAEETTPRAKRTDVATVLYTSGTTGHPKGVVLTHDNILSQLADISLGNLDPNVGEVFLSILPCWHVFERTAAYWCLSKGMNLVYSSKRHFRKDLAIHQPHMLISVPRVFENLHDAIVTKLEAASSVRKAIFAFFMFISLAFVKARRRLLRLQIVRDNRLPVFGTFLDLIELCMLVPLYALANLLVWKKIRQGVGGRLRICLSGGGSIAGYLEDFFECAGIDICVGYGLTETSPVIANRFGKHNVRGSTGMPLPRAYVKIVDRDTHEIVEGGRQGVLYVKGPYVFSKYLDNPEATAKAFDADGYFNTGDLAYTAPSGVVVISGRSKHLIVLSNGENIEPGPIEDALLGSSLVDQVMLVGQDERALGALVVPKLDVLESNGIIEKEFKENVEALLCEPFENRKELRKLEAELTKSQPFSGALNEELSRLNMERSNYSHMDRIAHVRVILIPFTLENRMMTQTLKIKKNVVEELFAPEIKDMYNR